MLAIAAALREHGLATTRSSSSCSPPASPAGRAKRPNERPAADNRARCQATVTLDGATRASGCPSRARACSTPRSRTAWTRPTPARRASVRPAAPRCSRARWRWQCQPCARRLRGAAGLRADLPVLPAQRPDRRQLRPMSRGREPDVRRRETMPIEDYLAQGGVLTSPDNVPPRYRGELLRLMATFRRQRTRWIRRLRRHDQRCAGHQGAHRRRPHRLGKGRPRRAACSTSWAPSAPIRALCRRIIPGPTRLARDADLGASPPRPATCAFPSSTTRSKAGSTRW